MAATADNFTTPNERAISGAMALATHVVFFVLLVFSVTWQKRQPEAMVVDLWNNLPPVAAPKAEPAPEIKPEPTPPKPEPRVEAKPVPKAEPKPVPKAEPKPVPKAEPKPTIKPDIALKEKKEKERKAAEQQLAEKKKREQEEALRKLAAQQQAKEAEAKRQAAREQEEGLKKLAAQQAAAQSRVVDEYKRRIAEKIKRFIVEPPNLQGNPEVEMDVVLLPGGEVLGVKTRRASTMSAWDNAVERAIIKAQPLPLPPDPAMFKDFRELNLKFRPKE
jgi:colicin import membrane protein